LAAFLLPPDGPISAVHAKRVPWILDAFCI
jgi:hypothetical protein